MSPVLVVPHSRVPQLQGLWQLERASPWVWNPSRDACPSFIIAAPMSTLQWTLMGPKCSPGAKASPANADSPLSFVFFRCGLNSLSQLSPKTRLGNYLARTNLALLVCKQGKGSRKPALRPTRLCVPRALVSDSHAWPLVWQRPILWDLHGLCLALSGPSCPTHGSCLVPPWALAHGPFHHKPTQPRGQTCGQLGHSSMGTSVTGSCLGWAGQGPQGPCGPAATSGSRLLVGLEGWGRAGTSLVGGGSWQFASRAVR